jgi:hypothetical protein
MLVDYPKEWEKYMFEKELKFKKDTPAEIVEKAKEINKKTMKCADKPFFFFEGDDTAESSKRCP